MLRMDRVEPTEALHLLQCRAGVVVPAAIVPERPSALVRNPDHLGHELGKGTELRILRSLPQGSSLIAECLTDAKVQARRNGFSTMYLQCPVLRHDPAPPPEQLTQTCWLCCRAPAWREPRPSFAGIYRLERE